MNSTHSQRVNTLQNYLRTDYRWQQKRLCFPWLFGAILGLFISQITCASVPSLNTQAQSQPTQETALNEPIVWQAPLGQNHPLTGRIYQVSTQQFISEEKLMDHLVGVKYVLTGESHNNPDHHLLQLRILKAIFSSGRRVAVGFEIFTSEDQPLLDRYGAAIGADPAQLLSDLKWGKRRKALWNIYQPLIHFAGISGLPLAAMDLTRREAFAVKHKGIEVLPADLVTRFKLDRPLPKLQQQILTYDLLKAHCGLLFSNDFESLLLAQRTRDATMAERMERADVGDGVLLISGYGHVRGDRGVPYLLGEKRQQGELVNVLFASVKDELLQANDYATWFGSQELPFDYVWFTPRVNDEDPCDKLKRIYGKKS